MKHFGGICDPSPSHVRCLAAIGRELKARGHRFTIFHHCDVATEARVDDILFQPVGRTADAETARISALRATQQGVSLAETTKAMIRSAEHLLACAPAAFLSAGVDALIVDQGEPGGATVADLMGIPFASFCVALPLNRDPLLPLSFLNWKFSDSPWARLRNRTAYRIRDALFAPVFSVLNKYRRGRALPLYRTPDDSFSSLLQITQLVRRFDFPRHDSLPCLHYVGPYDRRTPTQVDFPWHLLDGRPLVYASLGTIFGEHPKVWRLFAQVCADLNLQAVISLGGRGNPADYSDLAGNPVVVSYAPQVALLRRASLLFTHAGMNTVMESLACGVPMVAVPIAFDQPGVGARLARSGAGEVLALSKLSSSTLGTTIQRVISETQYRTKALRIQEEIKNTGGAAEAADLIERVLLTAKTL